jgi:hypothetical protein
MRCRLRPAPAALRADPQNKWLRKVPQAGMYCTSMSKAKFGMESVSIAAAAVAAFSLQPVH